MFLISFTLAFIVPILAQTAGGGTDPIPTIGYGALGIIIAASFFGLVWYKPAVDNLIKRAEKAEAQRDTLLEVITKEVMPNLNANTSANLALKPVLEEVVRALDHAAVLEDASRRQRGRPTA